MFPGGCMPLWSLCSEPTDRTRNDHICCLIKTFSWIITNPVQNSCFKKKVCNPLLFNLAGVRMCVTLKKQDATVAVVQILRTSSLLQESHTKAGSQKIIWASLLARATNTNWQKPRSIWEKIKHTGEANQGGKIQEANINTRTRMHAHTHHTKYNTDRDCHFLSSSLKCRGHKSNQI